MERSSENPDVSQSHKIENKPLFSHAMSIIDDYLNAGTKEEREKAHKKAKKLYKQVYGVPYKNRIDR